MKAKFKIPFVFSFLLLFSLFGLLAYALFYSKPQELPSTLIGENVPHFSLPTLSMAAITFNDNNLKGRVVLLNVWASWCPACSDEAPMLMKIKQQYHVDIYGIDYKDDPVAAREWLSKFGNPYVLVGSDKHGDVAIDLGVYGTPETFVISPAGKIVYRHVGAIDQKSWDEVIYPIMKKYSH